MMKGMQLLKGVFCAMMVVSSVQAQESYRPSPWDKGQSEVKDSSPCPMVYPDYFVREREYRGYQPRYQPGMIAFATDNRPVISFGLYPGMEEGENAVRYASRFYTPNHYLQTLDAQGKWVVLTSHQEALRSFLKLKEGDQLEIQAGERVYDEVAFDNQGNAYTIATTQYTVNGQRKLGQFLLSSTDGMNSWQVIRIKGKYPRLEPWRCHSDRTNPPTIVCSIDGGIDLYLPQRKEDGKLVLPEPVKLVSAEYKPVFNYSLTARGVVYVAFMSGNGSDTERGSLQYIASYQIRKEQVEAPLLLGSTGDIVDVHNSPVMEVDSKGFLYVIGGAHWHSFKLWKSKKPYTMMKGWSDPEAIGATNDNDWSRNGVTYPRFIIDRTDCLHLVARGRTSHFVESDPNDPKKRTNYDEQLNYGLVYFRKMQGGSWEPRKDLVVPKWMKYSNWYQKLFVDRRNNLYVTYYCFNLQLDEDKEAQAKYIQKWPQDAVNGAYTIETSRVHDPVVLVSKDQGTTWKLALTEDFLQGMKKR